MKLIRSLGSFFLYSLSTTGRIGIFTGVSLIHCFSPPFYRKVLWHQLIEIGFYSLPVVGLTAIFTGMVLALQSFSGFGFSNENTISNVVVWGITRELGPVLAGLIVAGRIGASIAAEIATMRVTEQIDALITLSTNPYKYLIAPRIIASVIMLPMLVLVTDIIGVMGGFLVSIYDFGFDPVIYLRHTWNNLEFVGFISGIVKAIVFGFIIAIMGSYHGYHATGGSQGVGRATTNAVVSSSILLLLFNFIITAAFFIK